MEFLYKARDNKGNLKVGSMEAGNEAEVVSILREHSLITTDVSNKSSAMTFENLENRFSPIKQKDKVMFSRELATMINAGLPIVEALEVLAIQQKNKRFNQIIKVVARDVASGTTLAASLGQFPNLFTDIFVNMIAAGEKSGKLVEILVKLADHLEKDYEMSSKTKGAMIYPAFVMVTLISVTGLMMFYLIPKIRTILEGTDGQLPTITRILFNISSFCIKYWPFIILAIFGTFFLFIYYINNTRSGQIFWANLIVKVPVFGILMKKIYMARFARTASTLIASGLSITDVLDLTSRTIGNLQYEKELQYALESVKAGNNLSDSLKSSRVFPSSVVHMIAVGEKTGALEEVVTKLAQFYEEEVDQIVNNLSKLLEPTLIVTMGIGVAVIAYAIIVPIYDLTTAMKNN